MKTVQQAICCTPVFSVTALDMVLTSPAVSSRYIEANAV